MVKFTEYRKSFKARPETAQIHQTGFDYRVSRRQVEHCHNVDAFVWEEESETDSENADRETRPPNVPLHKYLHEKYNQAYKEKLKESQEISLHALAEVAKKSRKPKYKKDRKVQDELWIDIPVPVENGAGQKTLSRTKTRTKSSQTVQHLQSDEVSGSPSSDQISPELQGTWVADKAVQINGHSRPKKPVTGVVSKKFIPKPRPVTAQLCRPLKAEVKDDKPPFVPYGCMDQERLTCVKKTYNVRASEDIHPSALRAMKRRELDIARKQEKEQAASTNDKRKRALFNDFDIKMNRETSQWDTEYRKHYVGYDQSEYKRNVSERNPTSANSAARAAFFASM